MRVAGGFQVTTQALALDLTQVGLVVQELFGPALPRYI